MRSSRSLTLSLSCAALFTPSLAGAAELSMDDLNHYAPSGTFDQVTSISQFPDVRPTDWAYQALSNLIERYGCVAGYPDGTFKGQRAMTRFEAAALLNACLDRVTEVTDELKRLMAEFEKELAILKGRVDGLEAKVGELEASQFSTTTKLSGEAFMVLGGAGNTGFGDELTANYKLELKFDTSFTGKDLLRTELEVGNFGNSVFGNGNTELKVSESTEDSVELSRLFYQFPLAENWTVTFGARVRQDDMLAMWPSAYPADTILDLFTYAGARATYSRNLGAGAGIWYEKDGFSVTLNYVSAGESASDSTLGIGEDLTATAQIGYAGENWGSAFAYTYGEFRGSGAFLGAVQDWNAVGLSAYWQPAEAGWVPGISAGFGYTDADLVGPFGNQDVWSWMVGLQWTDMVVQGNALGMAIGSAGQVGDGKCGTGALCTGGLWADDGEETLAY